MRLLQFVHAAINTGFSLMAEKKLTWVTHARIISTLIIAFIVV
jgi:hypothetical protein